MKCKVLCKKIIVQIADIKKPTKVGFLNITQKNVKCYLAYRALIAAFKRLLLRAALFL